MASSLSQISSTSRWILTLVSPTVAPMPTPSEISIPRPALLTFPSPAWPPDAASSALGSCPTDLERYTSTFGGEANKQDGSGQFWLENAPSTHLMSRSLIIYFIRYTSCHCRVKQIKQNYILTARNSLSCYLLGVIRGDFQPVTADFIGGERKGLPCGRLQRNSALKGAEGNRQTTC